MKSDSIVESMLSANTCQVVDGPIGSRGQTNDFASFLKEKTQPVQQLIAFSSSTRHRTTTRRSLGNWNWSTLPRLIIVFIARQNPRTLYRCSTELCEKASKFNAGNLGNYVRLVKDFKRCWAFSIARN
jgi:hypothetical protein